MLSRANDMVQNILREHEEAILDLDLISEIEKAFPDIQNI